MQKNILCNTCQKFRDDRLRNDRALGNQKSDNNKNVRSFWPVSGCKNSRW